MTNRKAIIQHSEMNESMEEEAVQTAAFALSQKQSDKDIASYMKQEFDKKYKPEWSCVVGRDFGRLVCLYSYTCLSRYVVIFCPTY